MVDEKYAILAPLGTGGMGCVFLAENVRIGRKVAIKVLHDDLAERPDLSQRFQREAQIAVRIGSPHVVDVLDFGDLDASPPALLAGGRNRGVKGSTKGAKVAAPAGPRRNYLVMEHLEGTDLATRLETGGVLSVATASNYVLQILHGLGRAHAAGVIHHDLKPENVFIIRREGKDFIKVLDFGLSSLRSPSHGTILCGEGDALGTPSYMAPEKARGELADSRSDIYSVGVLLYESVSGRRPYVGGTTLERVRRVRDEPPVALEKLVPDLDETFVAIVAKAMHRSITERYQSAEDLGDALRAWRKLRGFDDDRSSTNIHRVAREVALAEAFTPARSPSPARRNLLRERTSGSLVAAAVLVFTTFVGGLALATREGQEPGAGSAPTTAAAATVAPSREPQGPPATPAACDESVPSGPPNR